jgi:hypothetical protein
MASAGWGDKLRPDVLLLQGFFKFGHDVLLRASVRRLITRVNLLKGLLKGGKWESTHALGVAGRALAVSIFRAKPSRTLGTFLCERVFREGAGNGTRGGRAPFQPGFAKGL